MTRNSQERYQRLSSALRNNLLKRKEQQRSRDLDRHEKGSYAPGDIFKDESKEAKIDSVFSEES